MALQFKAYVDKDSAWLGKLGDAKKKFLDRLWVRATYMKVTPPTEADEQKITDEYDENPSLLLPYIGQDVLDFIKREAVEKLDKNILGLLTNSWLKLRILYPQPYSGDIIDLLWLLDLEKEPRGRIITDVIVPAIVEDNGDGLTQQGLYDLLQQWMRVILQLMTADAVQYVIVVASESAKRNPQLFAETVPRISAILLKTTGQPRTASGDALSGLPGLESQVRPGEKGYKPEESYSFDPNSMRVEMKPTEKVDLQRVSRETLRPIQEISSISYEQKQVPISLSSSLTRTVSSLSPKKSEMAAAGQSVVPAKRPPPQFTAQQFALPSQFAVPAKRPPPPAGPRPSQAAPQFPPQQFGTQTTKQFAPPQQFAPQFPPQQQFAPPQFSVQQFPPQQFALQFPPSQHAISSTSTSIVPLSPRAVVQRRS